MWYSEGGGGGCMYMCRITESRNPEGAYGHMEITLEVRAGGWSVILWCEQFGNNLLFCASYTGSSRKPVCSLCICAGDKHPVSIFSVVPQAS